MRRVSFVSRFPALGHGRSDRSRSRPGRSQRAGHGNSRIDEDLRPHFTEISRSGCRTATDPRPTDPPGSPIRGRLVAESVDRADLDRRQDGSGDDTLRVRDPVVGERARETFALGSGPVRPIERVPPGRCREAGHRRIIDSNERPTRLEDESSGRAALSPPGGSRDRSYKSPACHRGDP
jgi:hypothetical protein